MNENPRKIAEARKRLGEDGGDKEGNKNHGRKTGSLHCTESLNKGNCNLESLHWFRNQIVRKMKSVAIVDQRMVTKEGLLQN